jgi:hypothetical protein
VCKNSCPPPKRFKPARDVVWAKVYNGTPSFVEERKRRGKRALGIRYEKKVHGCMSLIYGEKYFSNPWIRFAESDGTLRWCQPDGIIIDITRGKIVIVEVKYQHTSDAWWQLRELYLPVLRTLFGKNWDYQVCEVVKWYDPATAFPEPVYLMKEVGLVHSDRFGVHIWRA